MIIIFTGKNLIVNGLDKSMVSIKIGDPTQHGEKGVLENMEWDDGMKELFNQITMDLREAPSATNKPNISLTEATNKKLAVLPLDTYNESLEPNHLFHSYSNSFTFSPLVNFFAVKVKYAIFNLSLIVIVSPIKGQLIIYYPRTI